MRKVLCTEIPTEARIKVWCYQNPPSVGDEVSLHFADAEWSFFGYGEVITVNGGYEVEWEPPVKE